MRITTDMLSGGKREAKRLAKVGAIKRIGQVVKETGQLVNVYEYEATRYTFKGAQLYIDHKGAS